MIKGFLIYRDAKPPVASRWDCWFRVDDRPGSRGIFSQFYNICPRQKRGGVGAMGKPEYGATLSGVFSLESFLAKELVDKDQRGQGSPSENSHHPPVRT